MKYKNVILLLNTLCVCSLYSQKGVVFNIHSNPSVKLDSVSCFYVCIPKLDQPCRHRPFSLVKEVIISDSTSYAIMGHLDAPMLLNLGAQNTRYTLAIVTPGDSIDVYLLKDPNDDELNYLWFSGRNENNYNFRRIIDQKLTKYSVAPDMKMSKYMTLVDSVNQLNQQIVKETFPESQIRSVLLDEEVMKAYSAILIQIDRTVEDVLPEDYAAIRRKYFATKISSEKEAFRLKSDIFTSGLLYAYAIFEKEAKHNSILATSKDTLDKYFDEEFHDYLYDRALYIATSGEEIKTIDPSVVDRWYEKHSELIQNPKITKCLENTYMNYKILNRAFPPNVRKETLIDLGTNNVVDFEGIVRKYVGQKLLVLNWSTWNEHSVSAMKEWAAYAAEFEKDGYRIVYIAFDPAKNLSKVRQVVKELNIASQSYLLTSSFKSEYAKFLLVKNVPHSILLDQEGGIVNYQR